MKGVYLHSRRNCEPVRHRHAAGPVEWTTSGDFWKSRFWPAVILLIILSILFVYVEMEGAAGSLSRRLGHEFHHATMNGGAR
jgi:hypothetical protein